MVPATIISTTREITTQTYIVSPLINESAIYVKLRTMIRISKIPIPRALNTIIAMNCNTITYMNNWFAVEKADSKLAYRGKEPR